MVATSPATITKRHESVTRDYRKYISMKKIDERTTRSQKEYSNRRKILINI